MYHAKLWPMGEIVLEDGSKILVPQPIAPDELPPIGPLEDFYLTSTGLTLPAPTQPARTKPKHRRDPPWAVLCILAGSFLSVASGVFLTVLGAMVR